MAWEHPISQHDLTTRAIVSMNYWAFIPPFIDLAKSIRRIFILCIVSQFMNHGSSKNQEITSSVRFFHSSVLQILVAFWDMSSKLYKKQSFSFDHRLPVICKLYFVSIKNGPLPQLLPSDLGLRHQQLPQAMLKPSDSRIPRCLIPSLLPPHRT